MPSVFDSRILSLGNQTADESVPVYKRLALRILESIRKHHRVGDYLMPEVKLAQKYGVNRNTIRHALDELEQDGIILRKAGKGTLVISAPIDYHVDRDTRLTAKLQELGYETRIKSLSKEVYAPQQLEGLAKLKLAEDEQVVRIRTLRYAAETPISLIEHYLSADRFPKIMTRYGSNSLQNFLHTHYRINCERVENVVSASLPDDEIASALQIPVSDPILCIKTLNRNAEGDNEPVELSVSYSRADCLQIEMSYL
jgi:GntR family phosphonate transport system transcriptional regulator